MATLVNTGRAIGLKGALGPSRVIASFLFGVMLADDDRVRFAARLDQLQAVEP